jgi:hypothetical protein
MLIMLSTSQIVTGKENQCLFKELRQADFHKKVKVPNEISLESLLLKC